MSVPCCHHTFDRSSSNALRAALARDRAAAEGALTCWCTLVAPRGSRARSPRRKGAAYRWHRLAASPASISPSRAPILAGARYDTDHSHWRCRPRRSPSAAPMNVCGAGSAHTVSSPLTLVYRVPLPRDCGTAACRSLWSAIGAWRPISNADRRFDTELNEASD